MVVDATWREDGAMLAGVRDESGQPGPVLYKRTTPDAQWTPFDTGYGPDDHRQVRALASIPGSRNPLLARGALNVARSTDGGGQWTGMWREWRQIYQLTRPVRVRRGTGRKVKAERETHQGDALGEGVRPVPVPTGHRGAKSEGAKANRSSGLAAKPETEGAPSTGKVARPTTPNSCNRASNLINCSVSEIRIEGLVANLLFSCFLRNVGTGIQPSLPPRYCRAAPSCRASGPSSVAARTPTGVGRAALARALS